MAESKNKKTTSNSKVTKKTTTTSKNNVTTKKVQNKVSTTPKKKNTPKTNTSSKKQSSSSKKNVVSNSNIESTTKKQPKLDKTKKTTKETKIDVKTLDKTKKITEEPKKVPKSLTKNTNKQVEIISEVKDKKKATRKNILGKKVSNFFSKISGKLKTIKLKDKRKISLKEKKKKGPAKVKIKKSKNLSIFTKKTKKWFIVISILCILIILLEGAYFIYHKIEIDRNTTYYDSLNSISIDDTDIVAVGSSQFRYSKNYGYTNGLEKAKLIKYDKDGNIIFEKMYEKGINTTFSSIITVNDGYVVVGSGEFSEQEQEDEAREAIIIKYDKDGNIVWEKFYQVVTNTRFNKVIETSDGYIAIGQSIYANMEMGNHTTGGGIIVKYDFDGNVVWYNNHGGMKSGNFNDIVEVDGDFYVVGKDATDSGNIIKYNKDGQYQWHKNYSYTDGIGFTGITYLNNALYVVGSKKVLPEGTSDDDDRTTTNTDALLVKYDLDGKILWEKSFGGSNYERYNSILTYGNNLYVVGHTSSTDCGFKINTDGELMTGMLVRYDEDGNILKKDTLGGSNNDNLTDIVTDGVSLYITAYSNSNDGNITTAKNNGKDYFGKIIKLDYKFRTLMIK